MQDSEDRAGGDEGWAEGAGRIRSYHRGSKHHPHRYAPSPGHLDWANQPDPFRTYAGAPGVDLPLLADAVPASYGDLYDPGAVRPRRPDLTTVAVLFELALGLSAWKEYRGSRWALRCNPSSGNLHPTEGYAVLPALPALEAGIYHYNSFRHRLERRCTLTADGAGRLAGSLPPGCFLVGLSSVHGRESWKYGVRAYRYCQHDLGHALAAVRYAAATLGWSALLLDHPGDDDVATWLGLDRGADVATLDPFDREHPGGLLLVGPPLLAAADPDARALAGGAWAGTPNPLSRMHVRWDGLDEAASAARKPPTSSAAFTPAPLPPLPASPAVPAATLIRRRRSCLELDGQTAIAAQALYGILDHLLPRPGVPPWDALPWRPQLHLGLFVHRVCGLPPGLYLFERDPADHEALRVTLAGPFGWVRPAGCPAHLPLYLLAAGDYRERARLVSCHQDIAADGAFSLGMLARFADGIRARGAWWYRRLFWEAGVLGQVLYLEAEAAGVRGTGIGCYLDDAVHDLLGLTGDRFQSLYHFTAGGPVEDLRLRTLAPYAHLAGAGRGTA
jgi:SagB-type dehydrogenase family enzyme